MYPLVAPMMIGNLLYPRLLRWEVNSSHAKIKDYQKMLHLDIDEYVAETLTQTAFHNNTLGRPLYCTESALPYYNEHTIRDYIIENCAPERMTMVGVNVDHEEFCKWIMRAFVDFNAVPLVKRETAVPKYTGGMSLQPSTASAVTNLAIGFHHPGGWNSADSIAVGVYQALLGGCASGCGAISGTAGSKLTKDVLSMPGVQSCMSFNQQYSDSGLFGVYGCVAPNAAPEYIEKVSAALSPSSITADDVKRAKATLKTQASMGTDRALDMCDDIGRQMIMGGHALGNKEIAAKIDAVTDAQVKAVASLAAKCKPTVVAYGQTAYVPHFDDICATLAKGK
jgi:processing peptidase subunit alpha